MLLVSSLKHRLQAVCDSPKKAESMACLLQRLTHYDITSALFPSYTNNCRWVAMSRRMVRGRLQPKADRVADLRSRMNFGRSRGTASRTYAPLTSATPLL